jgi:hypothetical protein
MRFILYKTTCITTKKYYIGVHSERKKSDGYIGCGVCSDKTALHLKNKGIKSAFIDSVIKYGYNNFKREVLQEFDSIKEAYDFEEKLVTKELISSKDCLNIKVGGIGGKNLNLLKSVEIINSETGVCYKFDSQADCADFLGVKNISGAKRFLKNKYIIKGFEIPISIKKEGQEPIHFYDIHNASEFTSLRVFNLKRLLSKERKSCKGWFLADFDFNSSYYKNAKSIRKKLLNLPGGPTTSNPKGRRGKY